MAINKKLIHFKSKQKFEEELANGNILETSIVFILETTEIYTHGKLYDGSTFDPSDIEASIENIINTKSDKSDLDAILDGTSVVSKALNDANGNNIIDTYATKYDLNNKVNKDYVDNSIAELVDGAPETLNTLNEISAALKNNADIVDVLNQSIGNKQDAITDLETIRQGAAKGATALQSYTEQYKGTVTGVKVNGTTKNPSNGVVDLGTVITSHQDISGKQDTLVSGTNIKTINGTSILGGGNIEVSGGSSTGSTAYPFIIISNTDIDCQISPNTFYLMGGQLPINSLSITLGDEIDGVANEYIFQFATSTEPTTFILPDSIKFNSDFTVEANKIYQISILNGLGTVMSWDL